MRQALRAAVAVAVAALVTAAVDGQIVPLRIPKKVPGVADLLQGKPPLTTTLSDAVTEAPMLDGFDPASWRALERQPRNRDGTFRLADGGAFVFVAESYCLLAGSYAPGSGDGYLYAPLKGPRATVIHHVLQRTWAHPELPQRDVQVLLWAILSRTKLSEMSPELLVTAHTLLTAEELYEVNGGALGLIPESVLDQAIGQAPAGLRRVLQAEAALREMLSAGAAAYEEVEGIAVLFGEAPLGEGSRAVPFGRWSYHPQGCFIRYLPHSYSETVVHLYAPEAFQCELDGHGRVTTVVAPGGERIDVTYDDATGVPGAPGLTASPLRSVSLAFHGPHRRGGKIPDARWTAAGWSLAGEPPGTGGRVADTPHFPGLAERVAHVRERHDDLQRLLAGSRAVGGGDLEPSARPRLTALAHLADTLAALPEPARRPLFDPVEMTWRAWMSAYADGHGRAARAARPGQVAARMLPRFAFVSLASAPFTFAQSDEGDLEGGFDLSGGSGQPGNTGKQREGGSNRPHPMDDSCAGAYGACRDLAFDQYNMDFAECLFIEEKAPFYECCWKARADFEQEKKNCATLAQHCLEH